MENKYILTVNNQNWYLIDGVMHNDMVYYSAVLLDKENKPTTTYTIFKKYNDSDTVMLDVVTNQDELVDVMQLLTESVKKNMDKTMLKVGSVVSINNIQYVIVSYIPYKNDIYAILMSVSNKKDISICKVLSEIVDGNMQMEDVAGTEDARAVLEIHKMCYGKKSN
ncbi:MAG: hypothetical protein E7361_03550 [Clostridiales bacterium]|nr:hypothetical protein [Clostridiales bacterium]